MESWHYEPTPDAGKTPLEKLQDFPRHPDMLVYVVRMLANLAVRTFLRTYHRLRIVGQENIPLSGSFVLVANHTSHLDAAALLAALPLRRIHDAFPAAAQDYFFTTIPRVTFSAVVMNAMPFDRKENPRQSLDLCRQLLESAGHVLILFPEGTRSPDGELGPFKPGIGFLVAGTEFPVIPCYLAGAFRAWRKGRWLPLPLRLELRIGRPMTFPESQPIKEDAMAIATALREAVLDLR